uniref:Uncharacterized protein n=1 Tax=Rhipicephalus zambeziensis TaxID=60191 RepID=A0A224YBC9_9ACAR
MCLYIQKEPLTAVMCSGLSLRRDVLKKWQVAFPAKIVCRHFDAASKRVRRSVACNQWNSDVCVCDVGVSFGAFIQHWKHKKNCNATGDSVQEPSGIGESYLKFGFAPRLL